MTGRRAAGDAALADRARRHLLASADAVRALADVGVPSILAAADLMVRTLESGGKVMLCGNGGSAADCQHVAAELVSRLTRDFTRPGLAAIALTTDTSFLTGFANDEGYTGVFERQLRALGRSGDVLIGISTSGGSENVLRAVRAARALGISTIGLTGEGGPLGAEVDVAVAVPTRNTQHAQEALLAAEHVLCDLTEQLLFGGAPHGGMPTA